LILPFVKVRDLEQAQARCGHGGDAEFPGLAAAVESYAAFRWRHMHKEECEVLPVAEAYMTTDDLAVTDAAIEGQTDPLSGASQDAGWDAHFHRIVHLAPPPNGVGPMP
jgi:hemerythrin-like domain-containing protein